MGNATPRGGSVDRSFEADGPRTNQADKHEFVYHSEYPAKQHTGGGHWFTSNNKRLSKPHSPSHVVPPIHAIPTVFRWAGGGKIVALSGSFDNWAQKIPMARSHDEFMTIVELPEGVHQYKFLVDSLWRYNPMEPKIDNEFGSYNNIVTVKASDFEVFEALALDCAASESGTCTGMSDSPPGSAYTQDIPPRDVATSYHMSRPPNLPPHLLHVLLNQDTQKHCEPTLLVEPSHVTLNHLYALSIQDGVMALSSTLRYKQKYVTTLLYRPA